MTASSEYKKIVADLKDAKDALDANPRETMAVMKEVSVAGAGVFKIIGGLDAGYDIYRLYKEGNKGSLGDKALRGLKIVGNLGIMTFSGIAAAAAFGAAVIAAPIVGVVLGSMSLVKNTLELITENRKETVIKAKIKEADKELAANDIDVNRNVSLLHDLADRKGEITSLEAQEKKVKNQLQKLESGTPSDLAEVVAQRRQDLQEKMQENQAKSFVQLKESEKSLAEVSAQLKALDAKYTKKAYPKVSETELKQLKELDKDFLTRKKDSLVATIAECKDPKKLQEKNAALKAELKSLDDPTQNHAVNLKKNLTAEYGGVSKNIKTKTSDLEERKQLAKLFLGPETLKKPENLTKELVKKTYDAASNRLDLDHELKLNKIQKDKRKKNIVLGLAGLGVAIAACIPPLQALLGLAVIGIGVVAGLSAIKDYRNKQLAEKQMKVDKADLVNKVVKKLDKDLGDVHGLVDKAGLTSVAAPSSPAPTHVDRLNSFMGSATSSSSSSSHDSAPSGRAAITALHDAKQLTVAEQPIRASLALAAADKPSAPTAEGPPRSRSSTNPK